MSKRVPEMELLLPVFNWLCTLNILQDGYVAKKKKGAVILNSQAISAVSTGHVFYYVCYNVLYQRGQPLTAQLTGNPGEALDPQSVHYNWTILTDIFATLGDLSVDNDHRDLLVSGDIALLVDLLYEMYNAYSGESPVGTTGAKSKMLNKSRNGAKSVDSGMRELQKVKVRGRQTVEDDLEYAQQRHREKKLKEKEEEEKREKEEQKAKERAKRIHEKLSHDSRIDCRLNEDGPQQNISAYRTHGNRADVQMCHKIILKLVSKVVSGEAQAELIEQEKRRRQVKRQIEYRKEKGHRLVDYTTCSVHVPRKANHKTYLLVKSLVEAEIMELAMKPGALKVLERREREREYERNLLVTQKATMDDRARPPKHRMHKKHEEVLKDRAEEAIEKNARHEAKMARILAENEERAMIEVSVSMQRIRGKELEHRLKEEKAKQKEALMQLYYAEQKAKVTEHNRQRELIREQEREKKILEEKELQIERQRRGQELNVKLREKQVKKLQGSGKMAAPSLSPVSFGTGEHAAYFGESLGWQYLTETEFDLAQVLCQVRADPSCAAAWIDQRLGGIKGRALWLSDDEGRRLPMSITEGAAAHEEALTYLQRQKPQSAPGDVSIGLSLAARHHAIDLAYHGIAESSHHTGTDGSTLTQRVLKYGTPALRPGHSEIIFAVVRPTTFRYNPADILASMVVDDGNQGRDARSAIFHPVMVDSIGVGHAIATLGEKYCVEVVVFILAFSFIDKPVAWMSQSHYSGIDTVAAPFLEGHRTLHPKFKRKRDIYVTTNLVIGKTNDATPDIEKLYGEKMRKRQYGAGGQPVGEEGEELIIKPAANGNLGATKNSRATAAVTLEHIPPSPAHIRRQEEKDRKNAIREQRRNYRLRLARFYAKHAPHKLSIVDAALTMYEGKEEEMFFALIRKYGPEPDAEEDVDLPYDWDRVATEYVEEHKQKQRSEQERFEKYEERERRKHDEEVAREKSANTSKRQHSSQRSQRSGRPRSPTERITIDIDAQSPRSRFNEGSESTRSESRDGKKPSTAGSSGGDGVENRLSSEAPTSVRRFAKREDAVDSEGDLSFYKPKPTTASSSSDPPPPKRSGSSSSSNRGGSQVDSRSADALYQSKPGSSSLRKSGSSSSARKTVRISADVKGVKSEEEDTTQQSASRANQKAPEAGDDRVGSSSSKRSTRGDEDEKRVGSSSSKRSTHGDEDEKRVGSSSSKRSTHGDEDEKRVGSSSSKRSTRGDEDEKRIGSSSSKRSTRGDEDAEVQADASSTADNVPYEGAKDDDADSEPPTNEEQDERAKCTTTQDQANAEEKDSTPLKTTTATSGEEGDVTQGGDTKSQGSVVADQNVFSDDPLEEADNREEEEVGQQDVEETKSVTSVSQSGAKTPKGSHQGEPTPPVEAEKSEEKEDENSPSSVQPRAKEEASSPQEEEEVAQEEVAEESKVTEEKGDEQVLGGDTSSRSATDAALPTLTQEEKYRRRLERLYTARVPEKLNQVDKMLAQYKGKEPAMFRALTKKYGPEPPIPEEEQDGGDDDKLALSRMPSKVSEDSQLDAGLTDEEKLENYRARLTRLYEAYCPEKVGQVDKMMSGYKGREESMFKALAKKYGPEPPMSSREE